ncbi:hypothetical protein EVG20_g1803 [Dentipellis fragilis]|uniref:Protein transport protein sec16 n=1 Tax=Dentipellis fragilis TaxID=205917 RepID=A0A4Y9ZAJ9_9AGAM|nr:hypothetical protein EVG20_g1803 [Dentipellis fragilis]
MTSLEAAASLFGSDDPASDPFGAIVGPDEQQPSTAQQAYPLHAPDTASFPLDSSVNRQGADASVHHAAEYSSWSDTSANASAYGANAQHHYQAADASSAYYPPQDGQDPNLQWSSSQYGGGHSQTDYQPSVTASQVPIYSQSPYQPYAPPPAQHSTPAQPYDSYAPTRTYTQPAQPSSYDPYTPATSNPSQAAAPSASSASYDPYTPYAPAISQYEPTPHANVNQSYAYPSTTTTATPVTEPPPKPALNRPKTYDAYDPPLPPPKQPKRLATTPGLRAVSPAIGQHAYSTYNAEIRAQAGSPYAPPVNTHIPNGHPLPPPRSESLSHLQPYPNAQGHHSHAPAPYAPPQAPAAAEYSSPASYATSLPPPPQVQPASYAQPTEHNTFSGYAPAHEEFGHSQHESWNGSHAAESRDPYAVESLEETHVSETVVHAQTHVEPTNAEVEHPYSSDFPIESEAAPVHVNGYEPYSSSDNWSGFVEDNAAPSHEDTLEDPEGASWGREAGTATPRTTKAADFAHTSPPLPAADFAASSSSIPVPITQGTTVPVASPPRAFARAKSPPRAMSPARAMSPGAASISSHTSKLSHVSSPQAPYDPYNPVTALSTSPASRVSSPSSMRSWKSPRVSAYDPYAPAAGTDASAPRERSMSNGSAYSISSALQDPYAPGQRPRQGSDLAPNKRYSYQSTPLKSSAVDQGPSQVLFVGGQTQAPYAPSPSLLGTNDPLGRTSGRAPIISFGFGGKFVTCKHGSSTLSTGFDVALSSRQTTSIEIRLLHTVIPESALDSSITSYPGPLFCDPGASTSLVRTGPAAQAKTNKARVIKYLEERADEISRGVGYLHEGTPERRRSEGKLVLVKLLKVMVENDGHLTGSSQAEAAARAALVSRANDSPSGTAADPLPGVSDFAYPSLSLPVADPNDTIVSTVNVKSSALDKIQEFLVRGDRRNAYHYALDERLYAHAMVIASSVDKEAWKEVVSEFIKAELTAKDEPNGKTLRVKDAAPAASNGRESLRVAYSLFSGQGAASVHELIPVKSLQKAPDTLQVPQAPHITPLSPNFPAPSVTTAIPSESLSKWCETAAMIMSGPSQAESTSALMALGDCLLANQWIEAAHSCYLLAGQASVLAGIGSSSARVILVGGSRNAATSVHVDHDPIIFSEIVEFAMSLATPPKGQDAFSGLPNLQAYKLVRAANLAEFGHVQIANRYCEAIAASISRGNAFVNPIFIEQLKELSERLVGAPSQDKNGSWMTGKMPRPSLDSIGNWLEGRLTKFIAGDGESPGPKDETFAEQKGYIGPFSHYSTISSTTSSTAPSPQPTQMNHNVLPSQPNVPHRTGSAQAVRAIGNPQFQIDRASSAMEYRPFPRNSSPVPRIASANAATSTFAQAGYGYTPYGQSGSYGQSNGLHPMSSIPDMSANPSPDGTKTAHDTGAGNAGNASATSPWWGSSYPEESAASTPTATTFYQVDQNSSPSSSGFVSLMDDPALSGPSSATTPSATSSTLATHQEQDDEEDLGFGNSSSKRATPQGDKTEEVKPAPEKKSTASLDKPAATPTTSWFSKWWKKEGTPGPVKATLGEENSFYYDKELKRWVNKKAGSEASSPVSPPPPPSRAQTASPGRSAPRMPNGTSPVPPPARAASAMDMTAIPPRRSLNQPRNRSNLVPNGGAPNSPPASNTPPPMSNTPPPPGATPPPPGLSAPPIGRRNRRHRSAACAAAT